MSKVIKESTALNNESIDDKSSPSINLKDETDPQSKTGTGNYDSVSSSQSTNGQKKKILIVGDWVVDEHIVVSIHRSTTASRPGQSHSRALHSFNQPLQSFCAAGETASILAQAAHKISNADTSDQDNSGLNKTNNIYIYSFDIHGIGVWHPDDNEMLKQMLRKHVKGATPYRIDTKREQLEQYKSDQVDDTITADLTNLADHFSEKTERPIGTARIMRIYENNGAKIELTKRIDFEPQLPAERNYWIGKEQVDVLSKDIEINNKLQQPYEAVVIKDMCKGMISCELITWLAKQEKLRNIPWFISTKAWAPEWLSILGEHNIDVRVLIIPQIAAQRAHQLEVVPCWITRYNQVSYEAMDQMNQIRNMLSHKNPENESSPSTKKRPLIIAFPEGSTFIARSEEAQDSGLIAMQADPKIDTVLHLHLEKDYDELPIGIPMASVFFSACIANMLSDSNIISTENCVKHILTHSMNFTKKWMLNESKRIEDPESWEINNEPHFSAQDPMEYTFELVPYQWDVLYQSWKEAFQEYGILKYNDEETSKGYPKWVRQPKTSLRFELNRAMTEVDNYVCCMKSKKYTLHRLVAEMERFIQTGKKRHRSYLLVDQPGSGKTHLARNLAQSLHFRYLPFNITQMVRKEDLLDCFDTIVTTQAQNPDEPILVFIDEINAKLESQHVYDAFLAPLEDGIYIRGGKTFHIAPCVWLFAGTEIPKEASAEDFSLKATDFISRLSHTPLMMTITPDILYKYEHESDRMKLERIYLCISLLKTFFPDVRNVSQEVLHIFSKLIPSCGIRDIREFIKDFKDIQYGKVLRNNIPEEKMRELCELLPEDELIEFRKKELISIVFGAKAKLPTK